MAQSIPPFQSYILENPLLPDETQFLNASDRCDECQHLDAFHAFVRNLFNLDIGDYYKCVIPCCNCNKDA